MHHLKFRNILSVVALCLSASAIAITIPVDVKYGLEQGFGNKHLYAQAIDFHYTHLWTSKNGTTQFAECYMKGFKSQVYAKGTPPISKPFSNCNQPLRQDTAIGKGLWQRFGSLVRQVCGEDRPGIVR